MTLNTNVYSRGCGNERADFTAPFSAYGMAHVARSAMRKAGARLPARFHHADSMSFCRVQSILKDTRAVSFGPTRTTWVWAGPLGGLQVTRTFPAGTTASVGVAPAPAPLMLTVQ